MEVIATGSYSLNFIIFRPITFPYVSSERSQTFLLYRDLLQKIIITLPLQLYSSVSIPLFHLRNVADISVVPKPIRRGYNIRLLRTQSTSFSSYYKLQWLYDKLFRSTLVANGQSFWPERVQEVAFSAAEIHQLRGTRGVQNK